MQKLIPLVIILVTLVVACRRKPIKTKLTINTKIKYTESKNYQKHFSLDDRIMIQKIITEHREQNGAFSLMLKDVGNMMEKDPSTISKEVKLHRIFKGRGSDSRLGSYNSICQHYKECKLRIGDIYHPTAFIKNTRKCIDNCKEYTETVCPSLLKFPWVCNGCPNTKACHLNKFFYYSDIAQNDYKDNLVSTREGINLTQDEFKILNHIVSEHIKNKQPIYHIMKSNELPVCERTIYNYIEKGYCEAKSVDLRRKVVYKKRYSHKEDKTILRTIKKGRTYEDYQAYILSHPDASVVQMDTVISATGSSKVLLTLHFVKFHFQLAYIMPSKEAANVTMIFNDICNTVGIDLFQQLFEVILTDNGTEFSDPLSIESEPETGEIRSKVFFCHPYSSSEKGACEKNHEYIRYVLPKGTSFEFLNQTLVNKMMSHINSTIRPSVKGSPYDYMALSYGTELLDKLEIKKIDSSLVSLCPKLLTK